MIANSQPPPAATDACNTHLGSAPGLLQHLNTTHMSSLSVSLSPSLTGVLFVLFGFFEAASFGTDKKKYIQKCARA